MQISSEMKNHKVFVLNTQDRETIQDFKPYRKVFVIRESGLLRENLIKAESKQIKKSSLDELKIVYLGRYLFGKGD